MDRSRSNKISKRKTFLRRLSRLRALGTGRGWILNPIQSEREEWSECVRGKGSERLDSENSVPEDAAEEFDSVIKAGF